MAFNLGKLGQIAEARGERELARIRYQQALALHEQLGMPEAEQVRGFLAALDRPPSTHSHPPEALLVAVTRAVRDAVRGKGPREEVLATVRDAGAASDVPQEHVTFFQALAIVLENTDETAQSELAALAKPLLESLALPDARVALADTLARLFDDLSAPQHAVAFQSTAIDTLRAQPLNPENEQYLSVLLFNLAGYLAKAGRLGEAVAALEEVVAIDERLGLEDLASDRQALEHMRRRRDGLPDEPDLPPEAAQQLQEPEAYLASLSDAEREAFLQTAQRNAINQQADIIVTSAIQAAREGQLANLLPQLDEAAAAFADGEEPGSPYDQLAAFTRAVAARLRGQPPLPVPPPFVARFAALEEGLSGGT